jgi:hypothetical protein
VCERKELAKQKKKKKKDTKEIENQIKYETGKKGS